MNDSFADPHLQSSRVPRAVKVGMLVAIIVMLALGSLTPRTASAHARLVTSDPPSGSALGAVPASLSLTFSEEVDPGFSAASLRDASGAEWAVGEIALSTDGLVVTVPVVDYDSMPPGTYTLVWRVLSAVDGHVTTGVVAFSAGTGEAPAVAGTADARPPWWRIANRWLWLAGITASAGALFFALVVSRAALSGRDHTIATASAFVALLAALFAGYDLGPSATASSPTSPPDVRTYLEIVTGSTTGQWWLVSALATALLLLIVRTKSGLANPRRAWAGIATAGFAVLGFSASGHAAATSPAWLGITFDWIHLVSVALWLGSLPFLWLTLREGSKRAPAIAARFSMIGFATVGLIVITGILRSIAHVDGPRNLTGADYGIVLIAKHLLFLPILVAAGINKLVIVPRLRSATARGESEERTALTRSASHFVAAELVFAIATLLAAAALTEIVPAEGPLPVDVAAKTVTIDQRAAAADLDVWLLAMLQGEDSDRYSLTISTLEGSVPADLQRVIVVSRTTLGDSALGDRFDATELSGSPGTYTFPAVRLGLRGLWDVEVIVRRAGVEDVSTTFPVDTSQAGQPAPRLVDDGWSMPRLTIPAWSMGVFALFVLVGGLVALMKLRELQPFAAAILLTMTVLIAAGFAVQSYRLTVPVTASTDLANPVLADDSSIARGESIYAKQCLTCHGPLAAGLETEEDPNHLHGDSADLTDARSADQRDGDLFYTISNGVPNTDMPAFDLALTDEQRWDVVNYLRTLQGR